MTRAFRLLFKAATLAAFWIQPVRASSLFETQALAAPPGQFLSGAESPDTRQAGLRNVHAIRLESLEDHAQIYLDRLEVLLHQVRESYGEAPLQERRAYRQWGENLEQDRPQAEAWAQALIAAEDPWALLENEFPMRQRERLWVETAADILQMQPKVLFVPHTSRVGRMFDLRPNSAVAVVTTHRGRPLRFTLFDTYKYVPARAVRGLLHEFWHLQTIAPTGFVNAFDLSLHEALTVWMTRQTFLSIETSPTKAAQRAVKWIRQDSSFAHLDRRLSWPARIFKWVIGSAYQSSLEMMDRIHKQFPALDLEAIYREHRYEDLYAQVPFLARLQPVGEKITNQQSFLHSEEVWRLGVSVMRRPAVLQDDAFWKAARTAAQWLNHAEGRLRPEELIMTHFEKLQRYFPLRSGLEGNLQKRIYHARLFPQIIRWLGAGEDEEAVLERAKTRLYRIVHAELKADFLRRTA